MARSETLSIVEGEGARVADLVAASVRAPSARLSTAPSPVNDIGSGARGEVAFDDIEDRFQQAFERKLLEPLSEIAETATLLGDQLGDVQAGQLRAVKAAAERQSTMLRDMLAFVRSAMWGPVRIERRRVDLRLLCERVLDTIQGRHPDQTIVLSSRARIDGQWDPDLVVTLLSNLIDNAVEHGPASEAVRVSVSAVEDSAVIEVTSPGRALDQEVLGRLFEPFNCGPSTRSDGRQGLGLGRYLAYEIARAHRGRIDAWSDSTKGTTFRVTLPRA